MSNCDVFFCIHSRFINRYLTLKGNHHSQGKVQVYNVRIPVVGGHESPPSFVRRFTQIHVGARREATVSGSARQGILPDDGGPGDKKLYSFPYKESCEPLVVCQNLDEDLATLHLGVLLGSCGFPIGGFLGEPKRDNNSKRTSHLFWQCRVLMSLGTGRLGFVRDTAVRAKS